MKRFGCSLAVVALLAGLPVATTAAPLRTLVYHYTYSEQGFSMTAGGAGGDNMSANEFAPNRGGAVNETSAAGAHGRQGTMKVEVISATQDGGLVVDVTQQVDRMDRPLQTVRCALYGRTVDVVCNQGVETTPEQTGLLSFLGRFFFVPDNLDQNLHWRVTPKIVPGGWTVTDDFTVTQEAGNVVTVSVSKLAKGNGYQAQTSGTVVYDAAMEIPTSVKLNTGLQTDNGSGNSAISIGLISDSMAKSATSENSH